jgi:hypothetical protein
MRRRPAGRGQRAELAWLLVGLAGAQLLLGLGVDRFWVPVRDPEFAALHERLAERRAEAPGRPLVLALGSSRTEMGLRAGELSQSADAGAPLVFNFGVPAGGPMFQQVVLRRLLDEGVRPDFVFLEVMPMSMSRRGGAPQEENQLDAARLTAAEAARLLPYYHRPYRLLGRWASARLLPADRHQAELREALGLDGAAAERGDDPCGDPTRPLDGYGWRRFPPPRSREEFDANLQFSLNQFGKALNDGTPAEGPLRALQALLALCRREGLPAALVIPPEGSVFRAYDAHYAAIEEEVRRTAREWDTPLYDARDWIDDGGFYDGHHLSEEGAARYTERFRREVLGPELRRLAGRRGAGYAVTESTPRR